MRKHRLMLDYDNKTFEEVKADAEKLVRMFPTLLIEFAISQSDQPEHWRVEFRKSELSWDEAVAIAEQADVDKDWLEYCKKYKCFAVKTVVSKIRQPGSLVVNPPVETVRSPFRLIITPIDSFNLRCCLRLCESIKDPEWVWREYTPMLDLKNRVEIGCRDESQAIRRMKWLSERVMGKFEIKELKKVE